MHWCTVKYRVSLVTKCCLSLGTLHKIVVMNLQTITNCFKTTQCKVEMNLRLTTNEI